MEKNLTFDQLPAAVTMLINEVSEMKNLLLQKQAAPTVQPDEIMTIQPAAEFLRLSVPTLYSKVSKNEIPFMKRSKRLYFSRTELTEYLKAGRKKTNNELEAEAEAYILNKKKGLNNGK